MSFFYEISSPDNSVLKRNGGFATVDSAKVAARAGSIEGDVKQKHFPVRPEG